MCFEGLALWDQMSVHIDNLGFERSGLHLHVALRAGRWADTTKVSLIGERLRMERAGRNLMWAGAFADLRNTVKSIWTQISKSKRVPRRIRVLFAVETEE